MYIMPLICILVRQLSLVTVVEIGFRVLSNIS